MLFSFLLGASMDSRVRNTILRAMAILGLMASSPVKAVIVTGFGVDTVTQQFVIDGSVSSVTHNPGFSFGGPPQSAQSYAVSGTFDAHFSRYWWSYFLDGDTNGSQGTFISEQNWLTFGNANVVGNIFPDGFSLPDYFIFVVGSSIFGDNGPCNVPQGPDTYCSGWSNGPLASINGQFANGSMSIQGSLPISGGDLFENFSYDIQAHAIPEPGMPMLFLGGFVALFLLRRRR
jgi:hypothetical protein